MKTQIKTLVATALCGLSLSLIAAPAVHAQGGQAKVLITAKTRGKPVVLAIVDDASGARLDDKLAGQVTAGFADTDWSVLDNGQLIVTKGGKQVLAGGVFMDKELTYFQVHKRSQNLLIEGNMFRFSDDPTKGRAEIYVSVPANGGQAWITYDIWVPLAFAAPQPGGGDDGGGFGGF